MRGVPLYLLALVPLGCGTTRPQAQDDVWFSPSDRLRERNPSDVALLPVVNDSQKRGVPLDVFRRAAKEELLRRRYAPLAFDFVDAAPDATVAEASGGSRGSFGEDASLRLVVKRFEAQKVRSDRELRIGLDLLVTDAATGETIWSGSVDRALDLRGEAAFVKDETLLLHRAIRKFVAEAFAEFPAREVRPGPPAP